MPRNNRGRDVVVSFSLQPVAGPNVQRVVTQPFVQTHRNTISQKQAFQHFGFSTLDITVLVFIQQKRKNEKEKRKEEERMKREGR